jgi:hypothetical protein
MLGFNEYSREPNPWAVKSVVSLGLYGGIKKAFEKGNLTEEELLDAIVKAYDETVAPVPIYMRSGLCDDSIKLITNLDVDGIIVKTDDGKYKWNEPQLTSED